jgi:hypothetical protein
MYRGRVVVVMQKAVAPSNSVSAPKKVSKKVAPKASKKKVSPKKK